MSSDVDIILVGDIIGTGVMAQFNLHPNLTACLTAVSDFTADPGIQHITSGYGGLEATPEGYRAIASQRVAAVGVWGATCAYADDGPSDVHIVISTDAQPDPQKLHDSVTGCVAHELDHVLRMYGAAAHDTLEGHEERAVYIGRLACQASQLAHVLIAAAYKARAGRLRGTKGAR